MVERLPAPDDRFARTNAIESYWQGIDDAVYHEWAAATRAHRKAYDESVSTLVTEYETAPFWPRMWYVVRIQQANIEYIVNARMIRGSLPLEARRDWRWLDAHYVLQPGEVLGDATED